MKSASVTELKANLSHYLRMVRRGTEVQVLDRGVPVARLIGLGKSADAGDARIDRLERAGVLRRGSGLRWLVDEPPLQVPDAGLSTALDEDREDRL